MEKSQYRTSYSALETFKQCPQKYKFQQIDRIKAPKSKEAVFGSKIHKALQYFHSTQPVSPTLDELLNYLKDIWPASPPASPNQGKSQGGDSGPFQNEQEDMIYFSEAIKILKNYHGHYLKIKDEFTVLNTETRFEILLENPQNKDQKCILRGIIDRIDKTNPPAGEAGNNIEIIDYKTTKRLPSQQDIDNNLQLSLYCLGLINRWPQFAKQGLENIKLTFYFLKHQETISTKRTKEQLDNVQKQVWEKLEAIEKSDFKPIPSALCDWCGYKNLCPMWKNLYKEELSVNDEQIKKLVDEFLEFKKVNSQNNKRLNDLKNIITSYLNKEKIERVFGENGYITRLSQVRYNYDFDKIKKALGPLDKWKTKKEYTVLKASIKKKKSA